MTVLTQGGSAPISSSQVELTLHWPTRAGALDASAYLLTGTGKVRSDDDMVFFNRQGDASDGVRMLASAQGSARFAIETAKLPATVERIVFCLTVDTPGRTMAAFAGAALDVTVAAGPVASFTPDLAAASEVALILAELYKRNNVWKVRAVAQGFKGGLAQLARSFGVDVEDIAPPTPVPLSTPAPQPTPAPSPTVTPTPAPPPEVAQLPEMSQPPAPTSAPAAASAPPPEPAPAPASPPAPPSPPAPSRSLGTVILDEARPTVSLETQGRSFGAITINLNWRSKAGGLFGRAKPIDLDLGCLFELGDGRKGVIQALGRSFGTLSEPPFIALDHDDRTGGSIIGETLRINGDRWAEFRRIALFAFIYDGAPNWRSTNGLVMIDMPDQPPVEITMKGGPDGLGFCGLALMENRGDAMKVTRLNTYVRNHQDFDEQLGWGMRWMAGRK